MDDRLCVIAVLFNPVQYYSLLRNYFIFRDLLLEKNIPLITIELSFNNEFSIPKNKDVYRLSSKSILFQKERLINYGLDIIKDKYKYFAWIDADVVFESGLWYEEAVDKLQKNDIIQLFNRVYFLPPRTYSKIDKSKNNLFYQDGVVWQSKIFDKWLQKRLKKELPFAHPGFAWAARTDFFKDIGIYDKHILGSGDTFIVDCLLNTFEVHHWKERFTESMKNDCLKWRLAVASKNPKVDYVDSPIYHLWHGTLENRQYLNRHKILYKHNFDPRKDIRLENNVYEWASDKKELHQDVYQHFFNRQEDLAPGISGKI